MKADDKPCAKCHTAARKTGRAYCNRCLLDIQRTRREKMKAGTLVLVKHRKDKDKRKHFREFNNLAQSFLRNK